MECNFKKKYGDEIKNLSKIFKYAVVAIAVAFAALLLLFMLNRDLFFYEVEQSRASQLAETLNTFLISEEVTQNAHYKTMAEVCRAFGFLQIKQDGSIRHCSFVVGHAPLDECHYWWIWGSCLGLRVPDELFNEKWLLTKVIKSLSKICLSKYIKAEQREDFCDKEGNFTSDVFLEVLDTSRIRQEGKIQNYTKPVRIHSMTVQGA